MPVLGDGRGGKAGVTTERPVSLAVGGLKTPERPGLVVVTVLVCE
jgi:hypothetical protein